MVICVLIIVNAQQCYALLPDKDYSTGLGVLIIISVVKLSDALVGFNNAVLLNSPYYRTVLFFGRFFGHRHCFNEYVAHSPLRH